MTAVSKELQESLWRMTLSVKRWAGELIKIFYLKLKMESKISVCIRKNFERCHSLLTKTGVIELVTKTYFLHILYY